MRDRDESRRQGYGPRGDEGGGEPDQWRYREDQDEWRHGSRWMHGSDRGLDRGGGGWRPEDRGGGRWEREETGYGPRGGEGYQGGYNMGMNYGQGGPQGQGFGGPVPGRGYSAGGYSGQGGHGYGGFGGHGYSRGEGSWRQGRWEPGPGRGQPSGPGHGPYDDDRGENLRRGFGMSPYGGYGTREQGAYGGDEERGTWGGSGYGSQGDYHGGGYQGSFGGSQAGSFGGSQRGTYVGGGQPGGRAVRAPRGYQRSDERIREDVCDTIIRMGIDAGDVDIKVDRCEVTLTGTVESRQDKRRLEDLAEAVSGVKNVHNQLRVEEPAHGQSGKGQAGTSEAQPQGGSYGAASGPGKNGQPGNRTQ